MWELQCNPVRKAVGSHEGFGHGVRHRGWTVRFVRKAVGSHEGFGLIIGHRVTQLTTGQKSRWLP